MTPSQSIQRGLDLQRKGRLAEAADVYRAVLRDDPGNVDALNLLSALFHTLGDHPLAEGLAREGLRHDSGFFALYVNLGNALQAQGRLEEAVAAFSRGLELRPLETAAGVNLASALNALGRHAEAEAAARAVLDLAPEIAAAHNNLGNALSGQGRRAEAVAAYDVALRLDPKLFRARANRARERLALGDVAGARVDVEAALAAQPDSPLANAVMGDLSQREGAFEAAIEAYLKALARDPANIAARANLGAALHAFGALPEATRVFRDALRLAPDAPDLHWNLALVLLQQGLFREGWAEYEWRWRNPAFTTPRRDFGRPEWDGADPAGRTILAHAEQGLGDAIQFARYVPLLARRGARVVVECRPPLVELFNTLEGAASVHALDGALPAFDLQIPMMSLPRRFGTTVARVPAAVPYLRVPPGVAADPRVRQAAGPRVGFAWAGSPTHGNDAGRSCRPEDFEPLFGIAGVHFFALQKGAAEADLERLPARPNVHDLRPDFPAMAAAMAELDLVISVDTAVAHLAGALGRPVWTIMALPSSYLWLSGRDDSPWYPTMRLYRRAAPDDRPAVFARLADDLRALAARPRA